MNQILRFAVIALIFTVACGGTPSPSTPPANSTPSAVPTTNAAATETAITVRVLQTITAGAPSNSGQEPTPAVPGIGDTVTPPPPPGPTDANPAAIQATRVPPTLSVALSPSVTPIPVLPTRVPTAAPAVPTVPPTRAPVTVSREALRGKILFKSTRAGGKYPNQFQYFVMDADGSNPRQLAKNAAEALFLELRPLEGYSPDRQLLVLGETVCGGRGQCALYLGPPESILNRSQGIWTPDNRRYRFYDPVWSPAGDWIAFVWNNGDDKTKNIYKGPPQQNPTFKTLTEFFAGKDTKNPTYSPDGSQLAFTTQDGPRWQIWVLDALAENPTDAKAHNLSNSEFDDWDAVWIK